MTLQERPRYNGAGGVGRRLVEADESTSVTKSASKLLRRGREFAGREAHELSYQIPSRGDIRGKRTMASNQVNTKRAAYAAAGLSGLSLVDTGVISHRQRKQAVAKARHFDPEHRRQRRIGMGEAALLGAGGIIGFRGGRGAVKATQQARKVTWAAGKPGQKELEGALRHGVALRRRDLAQLGGGVAGVTGAGALRQHAETRRGRAYE